MTLAAAPTVFPVPGSTLWNGLAVALVALVHVQIATFLIGGSAFLVVSECIRLARGDERHARLAHDLLRWMVRVFAFGAALAIFWVVFILGGLWGHFFIALIQVTYWAFIFEAGFFLVEIILLYVLYANWDRLGRHGAMRLGVMVLLGLAFFWQQFFIDVVASYMLSPNGGDASQLAQVLNPTDLPLTAHRTVGNIAWAGAVIAVIAALRYRRARRAGATEVSLRATPQRRSVGAMAATLFRPAEQTRADLATEEMRHWDWATQWGVCFALGMTLLQPWIGYSYAKEIQLHAYTAWYAMMFGDLSNVFLVQVFLLGAILWLSTLYLHRRLRASGVRSRTIAAALLVLALATLWAALPARFSLTAAAVPPALRKPWWQGGLLNPLGDMIPYKVICLFALVLAGLVAITAYLTHRSRERVRFGEASPRSHVVVIALGVTVSCMMATMGVIREHARQPYLIEGEMTISGQRAVPGASSYPGSVERAPATVPRPTGGP